MGIYEFLILNNDERADLVWDKGVFIDNLVTKDNAYSLYHLSGFFVEITLYHTEKHITEITAFLRGDRLEKYANKISIEKLMENE